MSNIECKIKDICILLNSNNERKIQIAIKNLYLLIDHNNIISDEEYDNFVNIILENNYSDVVIFALSNEIEKSKSSKLIHEINLDYIEILFYTLNWVLYNKFRKKYENEINGNKEIKKENFEKSLHFINLGLFICENLDFIEVIILNKFSYNRIFILRTIFYFLLFHEKFHYMFFTSSLLFNLIKLKKNINIIAELEHKNELNEEKEENEKKKLVFSDEKEEQQKQNMFRKEWLEKELTFLYKFLVFKNIRNLSDKNINKIIKNCDFFSELLIKQKNGETKIYRKKIIDDTKKRNKKSKISKSEFEIVRVSILIYSLYCYLSFSKNDDLYKYFDNICEELYEIFIDCNENFRYYIMLSLYEILKRSENYKYMNIFNIIIKLLSIFLNDTQNCIETSLLFFINNMLKEKKFNIIYKNNKFNHQYMFLIKTSNKQLNEYELQKKKKKEKLYYLVLNNNKDKESLVMNNYNDLIKYIKNMKNTNFLEINNIFILKIKKNEIHRICLIFKILELYIGTCLTETKQFLINNNMKDNNNNNKKIINGRVYDNFFTFLTELKIKYFINHYVIVKTMAKYQHFINLYYKNNKNFIINFDNTLFFFLFLNLFIDLNKIFFIHNVQSTKKKKKTAITSGGLNDLFSFQVKEMKINKFFFNFNLNRECDDENKDTLIINSKKRKINIVKEKKEELKKEKKRKKLEITNNLNEKKLDNKEEIKSINSINNFIVQFKKENVYEKYFFDYKYIYNKINSDAIRNTEFLNIFKELINYKILVEVYKKKKIAHINNNEIINDENVLIQNMKHLNDYKCHFENEVNYHNKVKEIIYFFIPMNITKFLLKITKRNKHHYYSYFIISYLYYCLEIYKCISLFILSLDSFINMPKGIDKIKLLKSIKLDISTYFYNLLSSYYMFDISYINKYILNDNQENVLNNDMSNNKNIYLNKKGKEYEHINNDSDDYIFNIDVNDKVTELTESNKENNNILSLHYFLNNVNINKDNIYIFHLILLKNYINLFDECELKKKLLNELYNKKKIIEIKDFSLFFNINENIYKVFIKILVKNCYFTIENFNFLDNLFFIFIYYRRKLVTQEEEENKKYYEKYYYYTELFLYRLLKKTSYFDSKNFDDLNLYFNYLRKIYNLREFVIALSLFYRIFNLCKNKLKNIENHNKKNRNKNMYNCESSVFFNFIIEFFFTNNLNSLLNGVPMLKIIKDNKEEKQTKNNNSDIFDYTINDIVKVYINYINFIKYVLLINPHIYFNLKKKLKKRRSIEELFYSFTKKKELKLNADSNSIYNKSDKYICNSLNNGKVKENKKNTINLTNKKDSTYYNELKEQDNAFNTFLKFQKNIKFFLKAIKNIKSKKKLSKYHSKIDKTFFKKNRMNFLTNFLIDQKDTLVRTDNKNETFFKNILNKCKNILDIHFNDDITFNFIIRNEEELFYSLCNIICVLKNYYFIVYIYISENDNINMDILLFLVKKINEILRVYLYISSDINRNFSFFIKRTGRYKDIENITFYNMYLQEHDFYSNNFFLKINYLNKKSFILFINILKGELFKKLLKFLEKIYEIDKHIYGDFYYLHLCFINKNANFMILKKEKHIQFVIQNLIYMEEMILRKNDDRNDTFFKKKISFMILFLLKKIEKKDFFINKLVNNYCYNKNILYNNKGDNSCVDKNINFLLQEIVYFFIYYMVNENSQMNSKIYKSIPLLIKTIMENKFINEETVNIANKLCKLFISKCHSNFSLNDDVMKKILIHKLNINNNNSISVSNKIENDQMHLLYDKDVEREIKVFIIYNYVKCFDIETLKRKHISKEDFIIMNFIYLIKNNNSLLFKQNSLKFLDNLTYEKIYDLNKRKFSDSIAEKYLKKIIYAYENVHVKSKISFLLLNTRKLNNKNCLFIALSILFFLEKTLHKKERVFLYKKYNKSIIRRVCKTIFFYFYDHFYKNDIHNEFITRAYEKIINFIFEIFFKKLKKKKKNECKIEGNKKITNSEYHNNELIENSYYEGINNDAAIYDRSNNSYTNVDNKNNSNRNDDKLYRGDDCNFEINNKIHIDDENLKYNKDYINFISKKKNDYDILLVLLMNLLNKNKKKFKIEKLIEKYLCLIFTHISFLNNKKKKNYCYYESVMKKYIYMPSESYFNSLEKYKKTYILFHLYYLLFKYMKLRNLNIISMIEVFFKDIYIEKCILSHIEEYKKKKKNERILIFILKIIKIFYEEWYDLSKNNTTRQEIYLKILNKKLFNELKKMYSYTLTNVNIHIRNIFFVDLSNYLKSITINSILDNKLIDEVLKFKEFNMNHDNNYNWLNMNTSMINKTCLYFYTNESILNKIEGSKNDFLFFMNMNSSGKDEHSNSNLKNYNDNGTNNINNNLNSSMNTLYNDNNNYTSNNFLSENEKESYNDCINNDDLKKKEIFLKNSNKSLYCILNQNEFTKSETFFLAYKNKFKENIYDYLFLLCLIVSKLIFCFILMAEKLRIFFYHFRILYTYHNEKMFLNFDLLRMQEINRKIKSYIKKYPDIHFYVDYDNNNNNEEKRVNNDNSFLYSNENMPDRNYSNIELNNDINVSTSIGKNKKMVSYDEEKEHFNHLKKNENNEKCKFCIKFKQIHNINESKRILNLFNKEEKSNIKNMIYYGKTIRTNIFLLCPYENNIYKNCKTFVDNEENPNDKELNFEYNKSNDVNNDILDNNSNGCNSNAVNKNFSNDSNKNSSKNLNKNKKEINKINSYCIVNNNDLLYGKKMKEDHFMKNYKKIIDKYFLNDIDFFGKWIKSFSMNALKILIFCLSSNDLIIRMISIKGLSIFYQLLENSFLLYKIRKKLNSFNKNTTENDYKEKSTVLKKKKKKLIIPFKELFYLYFFMKKLKYSVEPNSYYINPCVSSYSFFFINEIYKKSSMVSTLKNMIKDKVFSIHFFHAYLNSLFNSNNYISLNIINFFIISNQALFSTSYVLKECDKKNDENNCKYITNDDENNNNYKTNNYPKEECNINCSKHESNVINKSFYATSHFTNRMVPDFDNDDNLEEIYDENSIIKKDNEITDKLFYIESNYKNSIKTIYNILNKNNIFEIYLSIFFNNYLNHNLLKKFMILLITSSNILNIQDIYCDGINITKYFKSNNNNNDFRVHDNYYNNLNNNYYNENDNDFNNYNINYYKNNENSCINNNNDTYNKTMNNFNIYNSIKNNDSNVDYYFKNNLILKLITKNNILLWIDYIMHQKLFFEEMAIQYPTSFMFPILNFYDLINENESYYSNFIYNKIKGLEEEEEKYLCFIKNEDNYIPNNINLYSDIQACKNIEEKRLTDKIIDSCIDTTLNEIEKKCENRIPLLYGDNSIENDIIKKQEDIIINKNNHNTTAIEYLDKIIKKKYIIGYSFKESYDKISELFFYISLFINNTVSNLFYSCLDYSNIFNNMLLYKEKKIIKHFILKNAYNIIHKKVDTKFEIRNYWYNSFHKAISFKIRSFLFIDSEGKMKNTSLNIFSHLIKIIRNLNRSLYYIFFNLFHKEYFMLFIYSEISKKSSKKFYNIKNHNLNNLKVCKVFLKYIYLIFNILFNICTNLFDKNEPTNNLCNSISTKVIVENFFINEDISLIINEIMIFFENIVIIYNYFNSYFSKSSKRSNNKYEINILTREKIKWNKKGNHIKKEKKSIQTFHLDDHKNLLREIHKRSPKSSNYYLYKKIILYVLDMIHKNCYKNTKHFHYIFLNKLVTIYHFLKPNYTPKIYLYIYEIFNIIKKDRFEAFLKQIL
ncbi:conserved Plasmodium protein, unknown function [Plasmodium relictum]|uniref:Uncharacterized protein n=1 Tax=Plasmodium relictum TaxID=85471 RepID=A0A1J1H0D0_PLARL|nr:conserved Plasmodium protein, unknown function [Plasmodium relictum]CRG98369.1 conserved Plasmodium protein, unknown function [Plasmodium relictum]